MVIEFWTVSFFYGFPYSFSMFCIFVVVVTLTTACMGTPFGGKGANKPPGLPAGFLSNPDCDDVGVS